MAEDIDIEEHDLLQNPIIQRIFPDLSILKQEIMDFDEGLPEQAPNSKETDLNIINNEFEFTVKFKISGTQSDCVQSVFEPPVSGKIILGSKPNKGTKNLPLMSDLKVILLNIRPYLTRTKRFCDKCLILFPNMESLIDHELSVHESLEYNSIQHDIDPEYQKKYNRSLTKGEYTTKCSLRKYERNNHNIAQKFNNIIKVKRHFTNNVVDQTFDLQTNYAFREACFHCNELFPNQQDLIDHIYSILYAKKTQVSTKYMRVNEVTQLDRPINKNNVILQQKHHVSSGIEMGRNRKASESKSVYSCPFCSYYFTKRLLCKSHTMVEHHALKNIQIDEASFNPICKFCSLKHHDILSYNTHLRKYHHIEMLKSVNSILPSSSIEVSKNYHNYLPLHKGRSRNIYAKYLNTLVQNSKSNNRQKPIFNIQVMVSKIILYKCSECNIHFVTPDEAVKHSEHMRFKINWECTNCHRLFKNKDANIHDKQHQYSEYFATEEVLAASHNTILYKCPMCAVHFSKEKICEHCSFCDSEQSRSIDSSYCNICDIFIESSIKPSHENDHNLRNLTPSEIKIFDLELPVTKDNEYCLNDPHKIRQPLPDSMIIDQQNFSNIKLDNISKKVKNISKKICGVTKIKQLNYNFCNVCKCNIRRVYKTDVHLKSLCVNILKYICRFCGLMFSNKSIISHRRLHRQYRTLKLQDLTFYNLHTNEVMKPLIPEFPKCELCEKHFISKVEVKGHQCDEKDYFICSICKTKFSETAYKLHTPFHYYNLRSKSKKSSKFLSKNKCQLELKESNKDTLSSQSSSLIDDIIPLIYTCKNCNVSLSTYDDVIEHCHLHTNLNKVEINGIECATCQLKFENTSHKKHLDLHNGDENVKFTRFNFDVLYFGSDKWLKHIFKSLSKNEVYKLMGDSIYKYETRIKMGIVQAGPSNLTIYKCEKCQCIIDCNTTYSHIVTCCPNSEISDCTFCDLSFACSTTRNNHEKNHAMLELSAKSFRIVMFNREQDRNINNTISNFKKCYVVYECRFCHVLVDGYDYGYHICFNNKYKKCNVCGLILCTQYFDHHILKHKRIPSFNENKIKVVLIGNKTEEMNSLDGNNILLPSFNGIVCDFTFYKCIYCEVCVRDVRNTFHHSCLVDAAKSQCIKCDLVFDEGKLKGHLKLHDTDPDFTKETILVKEFTNRKPNKNVVKSKKLALKTEKNVKHSNENINHVANVINPKTAKLYKCSCGLHYVQQSSLQDHLKKCCKNKSKQSIQNCSKCGLSFTSDVLFTHLLVHHGDKNVVFKYEIVENQLD